MSLEDKIKELKEYLVNEKVKFLMYQNDCDPEIGFGLSESVARKEAERYFELLFKELNV